MPLTCPRHRPAQPNCAALGVSWYRELIEGGRSDTGLPDTVRDALIESLHTRALALAGHQDPQELPDDARRRRAEQRRDEAQERRARRAMEEENERRASIARLGWTAFVVGANLATGLTSDGRRWLFTGVGVTARGVSLLGAYEVVGPPGPRTRATSVAIGRSGALFLDARGRISQVDADFEPDEQLGDAGTRRPKVTLSARFLSFSSRAREFRWVGAGNRLGAASDRDGSLWTWDVERPAAEAQATVLPSNPYSLSVTGTFDHAVADSAVAAISTGGRVVAWERGPPRQNSRASANVEHGARLDPVDASLASFEDVRLVASAESRFFATDASRHLWTWHSPSDRRAPGAGTQKTPVKVGPRLPFDPVALAASPSTAVLVNRDGLAFRIRASRTGDSSGVDIGRIDPVVLPQSLSRVKEVSSGGHGVVVIDSAGSPHVIPDTMGRQVVPVFIARMERGNGANGFATEPGELGLALGPSDR